MARHVCKGCKSNFFTDDRVDYGDIYCSYCLPQVVVCPICAEVKLIKRKNPVDKACDECKMKYHTFPNIYLILRYKCFARDNFTCSYCGRSPIKDSNVELHCDHIIPRAKGGEDEIGNLTTSCKECNMGKMDIMLEDYQINAVKKRGEENGASQGANQVGS